MRPQPFKPLVWLLRAVSSRDAADAVVGDSLEELSERRRIGRAPRFAGAWMQAQMLRGITTEVAAGCPRLCRTAGLVVRDARRAIGAAPAHSSFVIGVLAVGITLGTVTFSVVDAVVFKPLSIDHPEQVVSVSIPPRSKQLITPTMFRNLHDQLSSVEAIAPTSLSYGSMVTVNGVTDDAPVLRTTSDFFRVMRFTASIGRVWTAEDEAHSDTNVAVLTYKFWHDRLGADPSVLGNHAIIDGDTQNYIVIGVLSAESDHPDVPSTQGVMWIPAALPRVDVSSANMRGFTARRRAGVTTAQVADEIQRLCGIPNWRPVVAPLLDSYVRPVRQGMLLALGAAGLVILVACANAANLMLSRAGARRQDVAIRASLGASRRYVAATVISEGLLLSFGATAAALLASSPGIRLARMTILSAVPGMFRGPEIALNTRVLVAGCACACATGLLCSLVPAWQTSRASVTTLLKDSEAPTATGRRWWRSVFLTSEIASVAVLLVISWLFLASLIHVLDTDLGIDHTNLLAIKPNVEFRGTVEEVRRRVQSVPGVTGVAVTSGSGLPLVGVAYGAAWWTTKLERVDAGPAPAEPIEALEYFVTPNYFSVAGLPLREGRTWVAGSPEASSVAVLDERAARTLFGDQDPVGRLVNSTDPAGAFTVIGTVAHAPAQGPEGTDQPQIYFNLTDKPSRTFAPMFVRVSRPPNEMIPRLAEALRPVAPRTMQPYIFSADQAFERLTAMRRFTAMLTSIFGLAAILIGAAGVYAVMASFVAQQTRELGVRAALGASPSQLQRAVLALAWRHLCGGLVLGLPLAYWLSRGVAALLFHVTPADPSVYGGVIAILCVAGILAAWIPARRAARIDPIVSLRR